MSHVSASHRKGARLCDGDSKLLTMVIVLSEREDRGQDEYVHGGQEEHVP